MRLTEECIEVLSYCYSQRGHLVIISVEGSDTKVGDVIDAEAFSPDSLLSVPVEVEGTRLKFKVLRQTDRNDYREQIEVCCFEGLPEPPHGARFYAVEIVD
jgi:hypothetical protein